ncbi:hypothetical protein GCM10025867_43060 [Frondihabitans sucicola]|uniref:Flippase-like domain-containing protein n=1 Tax=Frondihabitans sucicola TaxID=1268041 RepID=A0ABM8GUA8_9MICO|nr:lysylphosphatidylglycerol synthase domain-containing protein [Frondihabitans sucicola]BDZ52065.1 hypothetical protein GCM10025867_43060 [Frondihabitans sucicola]
MTAVAPSGGIAGAIRSRGLRRVVQLVVALAILTAVVLRLGTGPFLHGVMSIDLAALVAALALNAVATGAAAWRWTVLAGRFGAGLRWTTAVALYYRSQFVNSVLPGGVLGDVGRAIGHGRRVGDPAAAARAVVVERTAGQLVQLALTTIVLAVVGIRYAASLLQVVGVAAAALAAAAVVVVCSSRVRARVVRELSIAGAALASPSVVVTAIVSSVIVVGCHVSVFAIASAAVGASPTPSTLLTLAVVILMASSLPLNVGGWGLREGAAGWAFAAAGLGASSGVAASTLFGVLAIVGVVPGAVATVLLHRPRKEAP